MYQYLVLRIHQPIPKVQIRIFDKLQGRKWQVGRVGNCLPRFGRIEGATGQRRLAALLLAHPALGCLNYVPSFIDSKVDSCIIKMGSFSHTKLSLSLDPATNSEITNLSRIV